MGKTEMLAFEKLARNSNKKWVLPLIFNVKKYLKRDGYKILDVASGPGFLTKEMAETYPKSKITGIDISKDAILLSKKLNRQTGNANFLIADVNKLPFQDSLFDLVICKDSFHHFPKPKTAIKEMWRVLKPKGIIWIQDLRRDMPWRFLKMAIPPDNEFKKLQFYSARASYTKKEIKKIFQRLKIKKVSIKTEKLTKDWVKFSKKHGLELPALKISFSTRFTAIASK